MNPKLYFTHIMKMWFTRSFISMVAASTLLSGTAFACCANVAEASDALIAGKFDAAASAATLLGTDDAKLIAAEALSAKVLLGLAEDHKDTAKDALALSQSVLEGDPSNIEAQFQYALAHGFITRATSPFKAWRKKLPQQTKVLIDSFILNAPEDGRAYALLGAWHMGILRKTGEKNGEKWFGASLTQGEAAYKTALKLRPDDIIINANYAMSLAELDYAANGPNARTQLVNVLAASPSSAVEREVQSRVHEVLMLWDDEKALKNRIERFLDGEG